MQLNKSKFEVINHNLYKDKEDKDKCETFKELPFDNKYKVYNISDSLIIEPSTQVRDLGVLIDSELEWEAHYNLITKKSKQICGSLLNTFFSLEIRILCYLFQFTCEI